jgi:hypothetical protein
MSDKPSSDAPAHSAAIFQQACDTLTAEVENMGRSLSLSCTAAEILTAIKATMHEPLPRYGDTVLQALCERERAKVFNQRAAEMFPLQRKKFADILAIATEGNAPARKLRRLIEKAWKWDNAADRRTREGSATPFRGRPEVYDSDVVWAFADAIALAARREHFAIGHHGDETITKESNKGGPMFRVLVASIEWAMIAAWLSAAPTGTPAPQVKPEGILTVLKRRPLNKPTD